MTEHPRETTPHGSLFPTRGDLVLARDAFGDLLLRRAMSSVEDGGDFPIVWLTWPDSDPDTASEVWGWPAEDVLPARRPGGLIVNGSRRRRLRGGVTIYIGRGWVFHLSAEDGFQRERAAHRTLRVGIVFAWRGAPCP